jgi:acyl dehydratase
MTITMKNVTYEQINIGDKSSLTRTLDQNCINAFAYMSGDINPAHFDQNYAKNSIMKDIVGHGFWSGSLISTLLGTQLPGPGTIYLSQSLKFSRPVYIGDTITIEVNVIEKKPKNRVVLECTCVNQKGELVTSGTAEVIAPSTPLSYIATPINANQLK